MIFKFLYYIYKFIIFVSFIFGGGFILTITHISDFSNTMELIYRFKDIIISNFVSSLITYLSEPRLLSEQAQAKILNSFPKVKLPEEIPTNDQISRDKYSKQTFKWYEAEPEVKPFYTEKWFIFGCLSIITIGLTWYFYDDISSYFKGDDSLDATTAKGKGKFIDSTKAELDKAKLSRLDRYKRGLFSPESTPAREPFNNSISRTSSSDTITLTNNTKDAAVITSTGDITNTIASTSNNIDETTSRLRFSPQHASKEMGTELKTFFKGPDSPESTSSTGSSGSSLDSPTTNATPTSQDTSSFSIKTFLI
jgi:hypothetical protein